MIEAAAKIPRWLPSREAVARVACYLGYPIENAQLRIIRYVKAHRIRMRGRTAEGFLVYATGHGREIDWGDESIELCLDDLIEADLLPAPGRPEALAERARQPADRAIAYLLMSYLVEWGDWTPEMIRERERGEIKLGEVICNGLSAWGQRSLQAPLEQIPCNDFRSEMVAMKALPVDPLRLPKVVVRVDRKVGVSPPHRLPDYMGSPWCLIEVDWAGLKPLGARAESEPAPPAEQLPAERRPLIEAEQLYAEGGFEPAARAEESRLELVPAVESNAASPKPKQPAPTKKTKNRTGRRGPKPGAVKRYAPDDRALFPEILRLMSEEQLSLTAATQRLAENERVVGEGTPTSRARRLARLYKAECLRARRPHH